MFCLYLSNLHSPYETEYEMTSQINVEVFRIQGSEMVYVTKTNLMTAVLQEFFLNVGAEQNYPSPTIRCVLSMSFLLAIILMTEKP